MYERSYLGLKKKRRQEPLDLNSWFGSQGTKSIDNSILKGHSPVPVTNHTDKSNFEEENCNNNEEKGNEGTRRRDTRERQGGGILSMLLLKRVHLE